MEFKILDLFSGAGGFSSGFEQNSSFETLVAVDYNAYAIDTFNHNHKGRGIVGDLTKLELKEELAKEEGINMIIGGPPCQGFSNKGKKLGLEDERNYLFLEYVDMVERIQPEIFVIENVRNLITVANGYFIGEIKRIFEEMGYNISYKVLDAYDFGVPQNRKRAIVIGSRGIKFDFEDLYTQQYSKRNVKDAISDLSYLNSGEGELVSKYVTKSESAYQTLMRKDSKQLYNHVTTKHKDIALKKLKLIPPECGKEYLPKELLGKQKFKTTWSRLEWAKPSPTIDTRFDTPSNGKNSHPYLHRAITPREAARLQSFPDTFKFLGNKTAIRTQIGNAVPPLMAKAIADSIERQYKKKEGCK